MFIELVLGAALLQTSSQSLVTGTVAYRERIALTPAAEVVVSLDRFSKDGQTSLSELRIKLNGKQVPVAFTLPYLLGQNDSKDRFGVRAEIFDRGERLFESPSHAMVITNGKRKVDLVLVRAGKPMFNLHDKVWSLVEVEGKPVKWEERPPTITFQRDGRLSGFGGVNRFGGSFVYKAPHVQIDLGPMTLMAGPPERMDVESALVRVLPLANRLEIFEGQLVLLRGEKPLARWSPPK